MPLQLAFVGDGRFIAGGSDHGVAYVYEQRNASVFDVLHHALHKDAIVQTVSVSNLRDVPPQADVLSQAFEYSGGSFVFTATSGRSRYPYISVWRHGAKSKVTRARSARTSCLPKMYSIFRWIMKFVFVVSVAAIFLFLFSNVKGLDAFVGQYCRPSQCLNSHNTNP